ncbi:meckelin [Linepithema humile]|uniref:meckelin n=1 Tax=Linepithema humile TaxID=83485 RepID=UPI000623B01C|nr:PREDICTED: meckelin [Linepithema humile]
MICSRLLLFVIFFSILASAFDVNNEVREYKKPILCKYNEYFDTVSLSCLQCNISKHHVPAENGLQCKCDQFSKMISFENGNPRCSPCDHNMIPTVDGTNCILKTKRNCSLNEIRVDRNINGMILDNVLCVPCVPNTYPSSNFSKCLPCDREHYGHINCMCSDSTHVRLQNFCLDREDVIDWPNIRNTYLVKFQSQNIDSYYLRIELQVAVYFCKRKDKIACEHLSNICALTLYTNDIACMLFKHSPIAPVWLFYSKSDIMALKNDTKISQRYSLKKEDETSTLNFAVVRFALNGEFLSIGSSTLPCQLLNSMRFGVNYSKKCNINTAELLNTRVELLSPYLVFSQNNKTFIHPLPVIVKSTDQVRDQNIEELWQQQLVRKFFLVDNISGSMAVPDFMSDKFKKTELSMLRYMKSLTVLVNVLNGEDHGKIFAPFLIVEYDELTDPNLITDSVITIDYKVTFILKDNNIDYNFQVTIKVLIGIALILSCIKAFSYALLNYGNGFNTSTVLWFIIYGMGAVGDAITFVCIIMCVYLFVFYKGQTIPYILLPDGESEKNIRIYMTVAFSFKIVEMLAFVYQHWDLNIFFIDWEQPKTIRNQLIYDSPHTSLRKLYSNRFPRNERSAKITSDMIIVSKRKRRSRQTVSNASPNEASKSSSSDSCTPNFSSICSIARSPLEESSEHSHAHNSPISIWRTYFIANEWYKLQTKRKINVALQSIYTLFILQMFDLELWKSTVPEWTTADKSSDVENNFILQYAIYTFVYVSVYFAQWLFHVMFYERYIKNRLQEFVDLCSIANISVFLVQKYYGFYIHGRSIHGFADTDLPTLINNLKKEEDNLCAHRGLVPGTTTQTFIISFNQSFKSLYDELTKQNESTVIFNTSNASSKNLKQLFETKSKIRLFLMQFLDHCSESEDYVIKEQHILEKLCDIHFSDIKNRSSKDKSIFYIDNNYSFKRMVFYGNEWLLATFEITMFAFFLVIFNSCTFACTGTVIVSQLFLLIIRFLVKRNLCKKSLLDDRFLM